MSSESAAVLVARMREWAADPCALVFPVQFRKYAGAPITEGLISIAIFPEEVRSRPDDAQLLEFIRARRAEHCK